MFHSRWKIWMKHIVYYVYWKLTRSAMLVLVVLKQVTSDIKSVLLLLLSPIVNQPINYQENEKLWLLCVQCCSTTLLLEYTHMQSIKRVKNGFVVFSYILEEILCSKKACSKIKTERECSWLTFCLSFTRLFCNALPFPAIWHGVLCLCCWSVTETNTATNLQKI